MRSPLPCRAVFVVSFLLAAPHVAHAQPAPSPGSQPEPQPAPADEAPATPPPDVTASDPTRAAAPPTAAPHEEEQMSEGRMLVSLYNSGFQWGISPGVVFSRGKAGFALGVSFGYGFDTGSVILVPGIRLSGYFMDPNVYLGMPTFKLVLPIDRFAPFIEGGAGVGHVAHGTLDDGGDVPADTGAALMGGGGFMIHFRTVAFGAEASYQVITGTDFKGFGFGPILAIGF